MNHPFNLKQKNNDLLISDLKELVSRERELLTKILHYLREVENRKLFLEKGYPSMFAFVTEELGYSEGQAQRRIQAMRLIKDLPEVEKKIESGELSLTVASQVQGYIQRENKKRKLEKANKLTQLEKLDLVQKLEGTSSRTCEKKLAEISPETEMPREKIRIIDAEHTMIQFVANKDLMKLINRAKELTSHQNPEGRFDKLFLKTFKIALEKIDPIHRQQRRSKKGKKISRSTKTAPCHGAPKRPNGRGGRASYSALPLNQNKNAQKSLTAPLVTRYISPKLKDQIWVRDKSRCQFKDRKTGKLCGSNYLLELDHKYPFALGGEHSEGNLQIRCRAHNQYQASLIL